MSFEAKKYRPKTPCQRCGTSLRYEKGNNCVNCHVVAAAKRAREARLAYSREDWRKKMQGVRYENI